MELEGCTVIALQVESNIHPRCWPINCARERRSMVGVLGCRAAVDSAGSSKGRAALGRQHHRPITWIQTVGERDLGFPQEARGRMHQPEGYGAEGGAGLAVHRPATPPLNEGGTVHRCSWACGIPQDTSTCAYQCRTECHLSVPDALSKWGIAAGDGIVRASMTGCGRQGGFKRSSSVRCPMKAISGDKLLPVLGPRRQGFCSHIQTLSQSQADFRRGRNGRPSWGAVVGATRSSPGSYVSWNTNATTNATVVQFERRTRAGAGGGGLNRGGYPCRRCRLWLCW